MYHDLNREFSGGRVPAHAGQGGREVRGASLRGLRLHEPGEAGRDAGTPFSAVVSLTSVT